MKRLTVLAPMNLMQFVRGSVLVILVGTTLAIPAQADVVFTNIGSGVCGGNATCIANNGINQNNDPVLGKTQLFVRGDTMEMIANAFTSPGNFTLSNVMLPLQNIGYGSANVYLTADSGGVPAGAALESWLGVVGEPFALPQANVITLNSVLNPTLSSGTNYWLVVGPATTTSAVAWNYAWNATSSVVMWNFTDGGSGIPTLAGPWSADIVSNGFQIDGTPNTSPTVPEPATMLLVGFGLAGLAGARRKFRA